MPRVMVRTRKMVDMEGEDKAIVDVGLFGRRMIQ